MTTETPILVSLDVKEIEKLLPHRYPFMMIDRVTELEPGKWAKGYKMISYNEPQFQGHFPGLPLMPGVLQLEATAQLACITMLKVPEYEGNIGMFTGVEGFKFRKKIVPGDKMDIEVKIQKFRYPFGKFEVKASVDGEMASEGVISFAMAPEEELKNS